MNPQKNQPPVGPALLQDLQAEVGSESAPLLEFILRHGGKIAAMVAAFLLILGLSALWRWHESRRASEIRDELARISMRQQAPERAQALAALADRAPSSLQVPVCLAWGQAALENDDANTAVEAYGRAAKADADGPLGMVAALGQASSLLKAGKADAALALLQGLESRLATGSDDIVLRQMLAEAALQSGKKELAAKIYLALGKESQGVDAAYFRARGEELGAESNETNDAGTETPKK